MRVLVALLGVAAVLAAVPATDARETGAVRVLRFAYRAHAGPSRTAYLVLPAWYGRQRHPALPAVISPHGRGVSGSYNLRFWGDLPARGPFALLSPDGQGGRLRGYSPGDPAQIDDLAKRPAPARKALPSRAIDPPRVHAPGAGRGG